MNGRVRQHSAANTDRSYLMNCLSLINMFAVYLLPLTLILLLLKEGGSARLQGREWFTPNQSKYPGPIIPTYRWYWYWYCFGVGIDIGIAIGVGIVIFSTCFWQLIVLILCKIILYVRNNFANDEHVYLRIFGHKFLCSLFWHLCYTHYMCTPYYQSWLNLVSEICLVNILTFSAWGVTVIF